MIKNFLTVAWRSLLRNKLHSFINITGLAIGVSACMVIYLIVNFELSFNKGHEGYERIYRIHSSFSGIYTGINRGVPAVAPATIRDEFTGIESIVAFHLFTTKVTIPLDKENKDLGQQDKIIITEPDFFKVFKSYQWISGSPEVLKEPFKVVLTESKAKVYFGSSDPAVILGREIIYRDSLSTTVAGIIQDLPFNTDMDMTDFISFSTIEKSWVKNNIKLDEWQSISSRSQVFVLLDRNSSAEKLKSQLHLLTKKYQEKRPNQDMINNFAIQPLSDMHYSGDVGIFDYSRSPANLPTLTVLIIVAALLLVIGAINFINLETAQSVRRAKEVGIRKTLGSSRTALVTQFLYQSFIVTILGLVLALPLAELGLHFFSDFIPAGINLSFKELIPFLIGIIVLIGLLAGLYPAFVLSSFLPVLALKNQSYTNSNTRSAFLRKTLIVFQFSIAQVLIIAALVVGQQINFMFNKDIGFKKDAVVYFYAPWHEKDSKLGVLKNKLSQLTEVTELSLSDSPPSNNGWNSNFVEYKPEGEKELIKLDAFSKFGDVNYIDFYRIPLLAGRNLRQTDSLREYIINRTLLDKLGFSKPEDAIGHPIKYGSKIYPIVGVVEDFHTQSLHNKIEPVIIGNDVGFHCFNIRFSIKNGSPDLQAGLKKVEAAWKEVYPDEKFESIFLDDTLKKFYESEQRTSKLVKTATAMAIFISCLGLFGLVSYSTTQRMKEIGIRKVLGSSVRNIVVMLSKDFIILVIIAFVIATPIAWLSIKYWLQGFAYHIDLTVWIFIITSLSGIVIAFTTVAYQTFKAANSNPVNSLRNE